MTKQNADDITKEIEAVSFKVVDRDNMYNRIYKKHNLFFQIIYYEKLRRIYRYGY